MVLLLGNHALPSRFEPGTRRKCVPMNETHATRATHISTYRTSNVTAMDAITDPLPPRIPSIGSLPPGLLGSVTMVGAPTGCGTSLGISPKSNGRCVVLCSLFSPLYNIISSSTARPIVDSDGKVCALDDGMPNDEGFVTDVHDPTGHALEEARATASLSYERLHRRRNLSQISGGDSHGGGHPYLGALVNGVFNAAIFAALIGHPAFTRLEGFATGTCVVPTSLPSLKDCFQRRPSHLLGLQAYP